MNEYQWPYANEFGQTEIVESDVVVLGGGLAGCFAAIAAAGTRTEGRPCGERRDEAQRLGRYRLRSLGVGLYESLLRSDAKGDRGGLRG